MNREVGIFLKLWINWKEDELIRKVESSYLNELDKQWDDTDALQDSEIRKAIKKEMWNWIYNYWFDIKQSMDE